MKRLISSGFVLFGAMCFGATVATAPSFAQEADDSDIDALFEELETDLSSPEEVLNDPIDEGLFSSDSFVDETDDLPRVAPLYAPGFDLETYLQSLNEDEDSTLVETEETVENESDAEEDDPRQTIELLTQPAVLLRGLDKITGRSSDLTVAVSQNVMFGGLRVTVKACHQTPPTEAPESIAYVEVEDFGFGVSQDDVQSEGIDLEKRVFNGWMYASSPGINGLEHSVYDVWVIRCMAELPVSSSDDSVE